MLPGPDFDQVCQVQRSSTDNVHLSLCPLQLGSDSLGQAKHEAAKQNWEVKHFFLFSLPSPSEKTVKNPTQNKNKKKIRMAPQDLSGNVFNRRDNRRLTLRRTFLKSSSTNGSPSLFSSSSIQDGEDEATLYIHSNQLCKEQLPVEQAERWLLCAHHECSCVHTAWAPVLQKMRQHRSPTLLKAALTPASWPNARGACYKILLLQFCS